MPATGRAIIIGGSFAGLLCGLLLRRHGWQADIYERVTQGLAGRGAGIVTHQTLWDALDEIGIAWRNNLGVEIQTRRIFDRAGNMQLETDCPQTMTAWDRMFDLLRQAFPNEHYHQGRELVRIEQVAHGVTAHFADGSTATGDVLIGGDGIRSSVRGFVLPDVGPQYAGYVAWRGLVPESALPKELHSQVFMHMAFCLPKGEQCLGYPVAGPGNDLRPGHRRYNLVWYRPADEQGGLQKLLTDDKGDTYQVSIPPPAVSRAAKDEMRAAADTLLAPQLRDCWRLAEGPFLQAIYDVQSPKLAFGLVTIAGDASYVARPHCGAGVTKAADDATALVHALVREPTVEKALLSYEAQRLPMGNRIVAHARHLGSYLQAQIRSEEERQAAERHFSPEAVLRETATLDFLK